MSGILEMSLRHGLHFYDCLYIPVAKNTSSTLVSSDRKLLVSAGRQCHTKYLGDV